MADTAHVLGVEVAFKSATIAAVGAISDSHVLEIFQAGNVGLAKGSIVLMAGTNTKEASGADELTAIAGVVYIVD